MSKGYWVVRLDVNDTERYAVYQQAVRPFLASVGARFIVRAGRYEVPEGTSRSRHVVVEFESYEAAQAAYRSSEYQLMVPDRLASAVADLVIIEGFDPGTS